MEKIYNSNCNTYYVMAYSVNLANNDNAYLLAYYGNKTDDEVRAGAEPVQYVVARGWCPTYGSWAFGHYYMPENYSDAVEAYLDAVGRIMY